MSSLLSRLARRLSPSQRKADAAAALQERIARGRQTGRSSDRAPYIAPVAPGAPGPGPKGMQPARQPENRMH